MWIAKYYKMNGECYENKRKNGIKKIAMLMMVFGLLLTAENAVIQETGIMPCGDFMIETIVEN